MHVRSSRQLLGSMRRQRPYNRSPSGDSREPPCNGIRTIHVEHLTILQNAGQLRLYQEPTFDGGITAPSLATEMKSRLIDVVEARCMWDAHTTGVIGGSLFPLHLDRTLPRERLDFPLTIQSYSFRSAYSLDGKIDDASKQSCSHSLRSRKIHDRRRGESTDNRWW